MEAAITDHVWSLEELVALVDVHSAAKVAENYVSSRSSPDVVYVVLFLVFWVGRFFVI